MRNQIVSILVSVLLVFGLVSTASAKNIERGTLEMDGGLTLAVSSEKYGFDDDPKTERDSTEISATMFYYLAQNVGIGVYWEHQATEEKNGATTLETASNSVGPAISLNFSLNDRTSLQLLGAYALTSQEAKKTGYTSLDYSGNTTIGAAKLNYFATDSVAFNFMVAYYSMKIDEDKYSITYKSSGYQTGIGLSVFIK
ncbi:MAG: hypothetical protein HZA20_00020 [Nitrospirae bacterium]|nr:hypothetical protein [Nitrospirota bacterium]